MYKPVGLDFMLFVNESATISAVFAVSSIYFLSCINGQQVS